MNKHTQHHSAAHTKKAAGICRLAAMVLTVILAFCAMSSAFACTTFIVGNEVSQDGSHFIGRTGDAPYLWSASVQRIPGRDDAQPLHYVDNDTGLVIDLPAKAYSCLITPPCMAYISPRIPGGRMV